MPEEKSQCYLKNQDEDALTSETFRTKMDNNYFSNPGGTYIPFYSVEYKKYFSIMCFLSSRDMWWPYGMKVTRVRDKKRLVKVGNLVKNSYLYR